MSRSTLILTVVLVVTVGILGVEAYLALNSKKPQGLSILPKTQNSGGSDTNERSPIGIGNKHVLSARIIYYITGTVVNVIKNPDESIEVVLDNKDASLPKLLPKIIVDSKTKVFMVDSNSHKLELLYSKIATNEDVRFNLMYDMKKKTWAITGEFDVVSKEPLGPNTPLK